MLCLRSWALYDILLGPHDQRIEEWAPIHVGGTETLISFLVSVKQCQATPHQISVLDVHKGANVCNIF